MDVPCPLIQAGWQSDGFEKPHNNKSCAGTMSGIKLWWRTVIYCALPDVKGFWLKSVYMQSKMYDWRIFHLVSVVFSIHVVRPLVLYVKIFAQVCLLRIKLWQSDEIGLFYSLRQVSANSEAASPIAARGLEPASVNIAVHTDPNHTRQGEEEMRRGRAAPSSVITGFVFRWLPGETMRREENFTFLLANTSPATPPPHLP